MHSVQAVAQAPAAQFRQSLGQSVKSYCTDCEPAWAPGQLHSAVAIRVGSGVTDPEVTHCASNACPAPACLVSLPRAADLIKSSARYCLTDDKTNCTPLFFLIRAISICFVSTHTQHKHKSTIQSSFVCPSVSRFHTVVTLDSWSPPV